ncbi:MAG: protein translocase subunit SecD [bacterium]|nr:protein translocase subunit SecD [bacterium]
MGVISGRRGTWVKAILLLILTIATVRYDAPAWWNRVVARGPLAFVRAGDRPFRLGLDLKGGTHLVYEADTSKIPDREQRTSMEGVRDVIERRVNALGVAEPIVQLTRVERKWRLIVELAGVYDTKQAIDAIGATPVLEFKEQNTVIPTLNAEQEKELKRMNDEAKRKAEKEILPQALAKDGDFTVLARVHSDDPGSKEQGGDLGWFKRGAMVKEFEAAVFDQLNVGETTRKLVETQFGWHIIRKLEERDVAGSTPPEKEVHAAHILIRKKTATDILGVQDPWTYTGLGGKQLKRASLQFDPTTNEAEVGLTFDDEGAKLFEEITKRNLQKPIGIFLDGRPPIDTDDDGVVTEFDPPYAPVVQAVITDGNAVITGSLNIETAKQLARRLQAGALPVPISLLAETTVGATLGEESVAMSLRVAQYVYLLVAAFMILYYRLPGFVAVFALAAYMAYVLGVMKFAGATLTLSGIAGFIMSIGMAVDANVLVFERLREELRNGRSTIDALQTAFSRSWLAIRDSHATTLITCIILASFSSSVVKGFAVTLAIGTIVNLFTALTFTRVFLVLVGGWARGTAWYGVRASSKS